ncbi:monooxygenase 1 isoform X5 [Zea mays]|uniref:FAD-binding domain-containing protein n=1 Tax=Zea mays TaxID=4577 RepID=A0A804PK15_MAIZE|nr:monooxygenase 1 isoform X5 [Zea mays]|eukprot:XP_008645822.1 monooxygenase 1 isoform X5 [Zea mays]
MAAPSASMSTDGAFWSSSGSPQSSGRLPTLSPPCPIVSRFHDVWQDEKKSTLTPVRKELRWLKRKDLLETMAKDIPAGAIRLGCHVTAIHPSDPGVVLTTTPAGGGGGGVIRAKVLIGCDGSNSVVAKYLGMSPSKPTPPRTYLRGFTTYRHGHPFGDRFLRLRGRRFFVGRSPMTDTRVSFFVACHVPSAATSSSSRVVDARDTRHAVLQKLRDQRCPAEVVEMVRDADPDSLNVVTRVWYRPPWQVALAAFRKGAVTVAGDAMHAMGSYIGQGGSAALEDALVLARSLARARAAAAGGRDDGDDEPFLLGAATAIREYVRERRLRVARLSLEAFVMGELLRAKSMATKLACMAILALLGTKALGHTNYDCGRL